MGKFLKKNERIRGRLVDSSKYMTKSEKNATNKETEVAWNVCTIEIIFKVDKQWPLNGFESI
jgi:hypothetical protein